MKVLDVVQCHQQPPAQMTFLKPPIAEHGFTSDVVFVLETFFCFNKTHFAIKDSLLKHCCLLKFKGKLSYNLQ